MDVPLGFLETFSPRPICAPCFARLLDEPLPVIIERFDAMVRAGALVALIGRCLNCQERMLIYRLSRA